MRTILIGLAMTGAVLAGCGKGAEKAAAASNDPAVVTQEEIDLLGVKMGPLIDPQITSVTDQLRTVIHSRTASLPADARATFNNSIDGSIEKMGPTIREASLKKVAGHVTLAEIKGEAEPDAARVASMQSDLFETGRELGLQLSVKAVLKACDDTGAPAAQMCTQYRNAMTPEMKAAAAAPATP